MAFTKVVGAGIHTLSNITSHNINSSGIITATKFVGPIEGNITAVDATFTGNVSIAKTLTYEDVKNVDSVGVGTFREGIFIPDNKRIRFGNTNASPNFSIYSTPTYKQGVIDYTHSGTGRALRIRATNLQIENWNGLTPTAKFIGGVGVGHVELNYAGSKKFETTSSGVSIGGTTIITPASGGKLGVGTAIPQSLFDVTGASVVATLKSTNNNYVMQLQGNNASDKVFLGTTSGNDFLLANTSSVTERVRITSDGRIGINDPTPNDYEVDILKRDTATDAQIRLYNNATGSSNDTVMRYQIGGTTASNYIYFGDSADANAGQIRYSHNNNFLSIQVNAEERFRIASDGKVGINSTAPTNMLDVVGTADVLGIYRNDFTGNSGAGLNLNFGRAKANGDLFNCAKISAVGSDNTAQAGELRFNVLTSGSMSEKVRITTGGSVNIGVTASILSQTTYKLQVETATNKRISFGAAAHDDLSNEGPGIFFSRQSDGSPQISGIFGHSNTSLGIAARADLTFHAGGTSSYGAAPERLRITSDGKVGIGSESPGGVLDLYHATDNTILNVKSGDSGSVINLIDNATRSSIEQNGTSLKIISDTVGTYANSDIRLQVDGGTKMLINSTGEVGINNTNPQSALEVAELATGQSETQKRIAIFRKNGTTSGDEGYIHLTTMTGHYGVKLGFRNEGGSPGYLNQGFFISTVNSGETIDNHVKRFIIQSDGRVSLGPNLGSYTSLNMSSAADDLVVAATAGANGGMTIVNSGANDIGNIFFANGTSETGIGRIQYYHEFNRMVFYVNNGQRLLIDNEGKLIMGSGTATSDSSERFLVDGSGSNDHCGLGVKTNNNVHDGYIAFHDTDANYRGKIVYDHEHDDMYFNTNGGNERLRIDSGGNIGVGNWGTATIPQALSLKGGFYMQQSNVITWNNGDCDISGISGYHLRFRTYTGSSMTEKMRITSKGIIWTPIGPNNHNSTTAAALVNTSGRQVDTSATQFQTNYKQNLSVGWYTIAVSNGGRSFGRIGISETYSSRHQACAFYAGHHYGGATQQNSIHVITSGRHSGDPLGALRIKAYGTYDGAMLQVYLRDGSNGVRAFLLGDNMQTHGWIMKDWIADGTDPGDLQDWSAIDTNGGTAAHVSLTDIQAGGTATDGHIIPGRDDATDLGTPNYRFDDIFATNTTISSTSDERLKQDIASLTTAEMNAAKRMSALFKTYRWKNRVLEKGDKARTHTGVIAQQVKAALEAEGLDYAKYGFIGFDEWYEDSEGTKLPIDAPTRQGDPIPVDTNAELGGSIVVPAGFKKKNRYSIRIGELLAFIAAYNEQRFTSIESRLSALESS